MFNQNGSFLSYRFVCYRHRPSALVLPGPTSTTRSVRREVPFSTHLQAKKRLVLLAGCTYRQPHTVPTQASSGPLPPSESHGGRRLGLRVYHSSMAKSYLLLFPLVRSCRYNPFTDCLQSPGKKSPATQQCSNSHDNCYDR
jgi:hypothetical protein